MSDKEQGQVAGPTTRLRLDIAYDGTEFAGWAAQPGQRTVQGELQSWLQRVLRLDDEPQLTVAGRTDAGVHARGQVAHVDLSLGTEPLKDTVALLQRRLARALPEDIRVHAITPVSTDFDARFSALWRRYSYRLWDAESRPDPLLRKMVTKVDERLNVSAMASAAATLTGLRDFAPFCKKREGATTIRELQEFHAIRLGDPAGTIEVTLRADAFCHNMVRSLVGAILVVGAGQRDLGWLLEISAGEEREGTFRVLAPGGLTLEHVAYPSDRIGLAERSLVSRARRDRPEG